MSMITPMLEKLYKHRIRQHPKEFHKFQPLWKWKELEPMKQEESLLPCIKHFEKVKTLTYSTNLENGLHFANPYPRKFMGLIKPLQIQSNLLSKLKTN